MSLIPRRAFFDHIPKTGGTACYDYFRQCLGDELVSPFILFELAPDALAKYAERALVSGHFEPLPACFPANRFSFTVVRDPIERTLSEYSALLFDEDAEPGQSFEAIRRVKSTPLLDLLHDEDPRVAVIFRNRQTRHFASYIATVDEATAEADLLQFAQAALSKFDLVGVYDDLEGFVDLVCERLGIAIPEALPRRNVTSRRITFESIGAREQKLLLGFNRADMALLKLAKELYRTKRRETMRRLISSSPAPVSADPAIGSRLNDNAALWSMPSPDFGTLEIEVLGASIRGAISGSSDVFSGENTTLRVSFLSRLDESDLTVGLRIFDSSGALIYGTNTYHLGLKLEVSREAEYFVEFSFRMALGPGNYRVGISLHTGAVHTHRCFHWKYHVANFAVVGNIEDHFEGVAKLSMSVGGGSLSADAPFKLIQRNLGAGHYRSLVIHSPRVSNPSAVVATQRQCVEVQPEEVISVKVLVTNAGTEVWPQAGTRPVCCAYHVFDSEGKCIVYDGIRTRLPDAVGPNERVALDVFIAAPREIGKYQVEIDLVQESVSWFESSGAKRIEMRVAVESQAGTHRPAEPLWGVATDVEGLSSPSETKGSRSP